MAFANLKLINTFSKYKSNKRIFNAKFFTFSSKSIKTENLFLNISLSSKPETIKKIPFLLHFERLHHLFAGHFRKQILAPSYLKDPFNKNEVEVIRSHLPYFDFDICATNIRIRNTKRKVAFNPYRMDSGNREMQIFAGDYKKFTDGEIAAVKIMNPNENAFSFGKDTNLSENVHKFYLSYEDGMKLAFDTFMNSFKTYLKKQFLEKCPNDQFEKTFFSAEIDLKFAVYFHPIYILLFGFYGVTNRVVIGGVTGDSEGPRLFSFAKILLALFALVLSASLFITPDINGFYDTLEHSLIILPASASGALILLAFYISRQLTRDPRRLESDYRTFFELARETQRRAFYRGWFARQAQAEEEYHRWFRQNAFEDFRKRCEKGGRSYDEHRWASAEAPAPTRELYRVLGVHPLARQKEIEKAFKAMALKWHPDKFAQKSAEERRLSETRFNDAMAAYNVLRDGEKRRNYDLTGETN